MRWGVEQRLEFIEFRLFWEGSINRADIKQCFGVSIPQASKDLTLYQERAPGNMDYDNRSKCYVAADKFVLRFLDPDPYVYLAQLRSVAEGTVPAHDSWIATLPSADIALTPARDIEIEVLRRVLDAVRESASVDIFYQSMNRSRPDPIWRRITPHGFGYDGFRWHARAYCHLEYRFKDFLLPRILEVGGKETPGATGEQDWHWNNYFDVIVGPHPDLTESQKKVVAKDYGFDHGNGILSVRYAMLFYVLKRLGLLGDATKQSARTQHIVTVNRKETEAALEKAELQL
ncbi:MAG: transcriptional regulator [Mesorhizobium sp.]|uniref:WYL domain-containing protein n=1 Tax=Mesorhizobium sp. TaxID=1871066 RepID=UPI000FE87091|nr:WYL domain-containing protein [Mesorhizobium sp.]RWD48641.1 MAG: transcriptional regulator [Mesorhizobium sp.]RWE60182.1 MAG: transcriptional regulator [Mesorhizobium sp.]RWF11635.1 MAG: transcriptional regulator [Mesorhizobium sp.]RWF18178.1 MAG: transcriptional regulator [Mesorhizobium sp.]TIW42116.1 MAG: transcriptional regulator [Mesorhizobium sp.]